MRFAGALGEPGCGEDAGEEGFEGWHAAANYADLELDAPVQGKRVSLDCSWMDEDTRGTYAQRWTLG